MCPDNRSCAIRRFNFARTGGYKRGSVLSYAEQGKVCPMRMETGFNIKKRHISRVTIALLSVAVCLSMAAAGDDYRFIIDDSSYPAANVFSSDVSDGVALETGAMFASGESSSALDSRYRNFGLSEGRALNAKKWRAISITFR